MNFRKLIAFFDSLPTVTEIPGAEITVWQEHRELLHRTVGVSDHKGTPVVGGELYYFYSATKPITCTAVMQLTERGLLRLEDPVSLYLPEFGEMQVTCADGSLRPPKTPITIAHLLSMTAGLNYDFHTPAIEEVKRLTNGRCPTREIVRALASDTLLFDPGEKWNYSSCHDVLGAVIEVVTGKRYSDYIRENLFDPLGMTSSYFHTTPDILARLADQYDYVDEKTVRREVNNNFFFLGSEYESGGASLISCVSDYVRFTDAMANGGVGANGCRILRAETIDRMRENRVGDRMAIDCEWAQLAGYGYGLGVRTRINHDHDPLGSLGEFGWDGAKGVYLIIDPARRASLVYAEHRGSHKEMLHPTLRHLFYEALDAEA